MSRSFGEPTIDNIITALQLPKSAMVEQRVAKKLLLENGATTASDKRLIQESIEVINWLAALKPGNIGVADFSDDTREYLEIAILGVRLRKQSDPSAAMGRLAQLIHRAIPYPLLLIFERTESLSISMVHLRHAKDGTSKAVLDGDIQLATFVKEPPQDEDVLPEDFMTFFPALAMARQPRTNLQVLYQGWMDTLLAWNAATVCGLFVAPGSPEDFANRRMALARVLAAQEQVKKLRFTASRETQISRQVALNLEIKRVEADLEQGKRILRGEL